MFRQGFRPPTWLELSNMPAVSVRFELARLSMSQNLVCRRRSSSLDISVWYMESSCLDDVTLVVAKQHQRIRARLYPHMLKIPDGSLGAEKGLGILM